MIYEFSQFYEILYILFEILIALVFVCFFTYIFFNYTKGKYRFFLIIPLAYFSLAIYESQRGIAQVNAYKKRLTENEVSTAIGRLVTITQQDRYNYYKSSPSSAALAEILEFDEFKFESIRPKNHFVEFGCFNGSLKSELEPNVGEELEIVYVDKQYDNATLPTLCILKIEIK